MPPPEIWGPPVWTLLHTLAENVNEEIFPKIKFSLFSYIRKICSLLPCPDCSQHAVRFLAKVDINKMNNKTDLINMLYIFHNTVNKRKNKPMFNHEQLNKYKMYSIGKVFNHFVSVYHTKGNMNLLAESFQRKLLLTDLKNWLTKHYKHFSSNKNIEPKPTN